MAGSPWSLKFRAPRFSLRSGHPDFRFSFQWPWKMERRGREEGLINKFRAPFDKKNVLLKNVSKTSTFSILHTDAHDRLDDISTHHKPHFTSSHKCFQAFSQHAAIHRGAFRHGAHGEPKLRRQEHRDHAGFAAIDNEAVVAEAALGRRHGVATSGDRVRLVCVSCPFAFLGVGPWLSRGARSCRSVHRGSWALLTLHRRCTSWSLA